MCFSHAKGVGGCILLIFSVQRSHRGTGRIPRRNGSVVGWWNLKNRKLKVTLFSHADQKLIDHTATRLWSDLKQIEYL